LLAGQDFVGMDSDTYPLAQILEQKISSAIESEVESALRKTQGKSALATLQSLCSKIPSTIFTKYGRAGKNYITIEHKLGDSGNLFFGGLIDKSLQAMPVSNHHTIMHQNKICFIFRQ